MGTVALVGYDGGAIAADDLADHVIVTRSQNIPRIQEAQASAYHVLRELIELVGGPGGERRAPEGPRPGRGHRPGRRLSSLRLPARLRARARRLRAERRARRAARGRGRLPGRRGLPRIGCRPRRRRSPSIGSVTTEALDPRGGDGALRDRREREPGARPTRPSRRTSATCEECLAEVLDPGRPPPPLPVHQLHQLRAAVHDRPRGALRPPADDHGRVRDVRALPRRVRRPARPPLPRAAERLPGLRAAGAGSPTREAPRLFAGEDPLAAAARELAAGRILAVKGIGGFHLACRADDEGAVAAPARAKAPRGEAVRADGREHRGGPRAGRAGRPRGGAAPGPRAPDRDRAARGRAARRRRRRWRRARPTSA